MPIKLAEEFGLDTEAQEEYLSWLREREWEDFVEECAAKEEERIRRESANATSP